MDHTSISTRCKPSTTAWLPLAVLHLLLAF
jgi:hypothetical protein